MNPKPTIFDELTPTELAEIETLDNPMPSMLSSTGLPQSSRSEKGFTLDATIIVNAVSQTVRSLWDQGLLTLSQTTVVEGSGLSAHPVTLYEATFTDRIRSFVITEETYRALLNGVEPYNETPTADQQDRINTSVEPLVEDRMSSQESPNDAKGRAKLYSDDTRFPAADAIETV